MLQRLEGIEYRAVIFRDCPMFALTSLSGMKAFRRLMISFHMSVYYRIISLCEQLSPLKHQRKSRSAYITSNTIFGQW